MNQHSSDLSSKLDDRFEFSNLAHVTAEVSTSFTPAEMIKAQGDMAATNLLFSSVSRNGIHIGRCPGMHIDRFVFAAYAEGFCLGYLKIYDASALSVYEQLGIPRWLLAAPGPKFRERARIVSLQWMAIKRFSEADIELSGIDVRMRTLRREFKDAGLIS